MYHHEPNLYLVIEAARDKILPPPERASCNLDGQMCLTALAMTLCTAPGVILHQKSWETLSYSILYDTSTLSAAYVYFG